MADLVWSDPDPDKEEFAISPRFVLASLHSMMSSSSQCPALAPSVKLILLWTELSNHESSRVDDQLTFIHFLALLFQSTSSGAGYTFGAQVVRKFLEVNSMVHILRAHQLCMEGFSVLYDDRLSTVWSAPNYCYRCGNMASILEVSAPYSRRFNVFEAAPENERDGPAQQLPQQALTNVSLRISLSAFSIPLSFP